MRGWYQGAALTYAEQKATWALARMAPDLREGTSVTPASSPYTTVCIEVRLPAKAFDAGEGVYLNQVATDAMGVPYLVEGRSVVYYRGNEHGSVDLQGDRLWRVYLDEYGYMLKSQVIADNLVDNPDDESGNPKPMFIYWPDVYRLHSVEVTVTVEEKRGNRTVQATTNSELMLRNN